VTGKHRRSSSAEGIGSQNERQRPNCGCLFLFDETRIGELNTWVHYRLPGETEKEKKKHSINPSLVSNSLLRPPCRASCLASELGKNNIRCQISRSGRSRTTGSGGEKIKNKNLPFLICARSACFTFASNSSNGPKLGMQS
jgi:hypothetical protein